MQISIVIDTAQLQVEIGQGAERRLLSEAEKEEYVRQNRDSIETLLTEECYDSLAESMGEEEEIT